MVRGAELHAPGPLTPVDVQAAVGGSEEPCPPPPPTLALHLPAPAHLHPATPAPRPRATHTSCSRPQVGCSRLPSSCRMPGSPRALLLRSSSRRLRLASRSEARSPQLLFVSSQSPTLGRGQNCGQAEGASPRRPSGRGVPGGSRSWPSPPSAPVYIPPQQLTRAPAAQCPAGPGPDTACGRPRHPADCCSAAAPRDACSGSALSQSAGSRRP